MSSVTCMLNPLQGKSSVSLSAAIERVTSDSMPGLWAAERLPSPPDSLGCYWDELFNAVCARLERLAAQSAEPQIRCGVRECVEALAQLHASSNDERSRHVQQAMDLLAFPQPREPV